MADNLFDPSRLYEALKQYNVLPNYGNFTPGGGKEGLFRNQTNTLVAPSADKDAMAHEMTHAVQFNLLKEAANVIQKKKQEGKTLTEQEAQYLRAAEQIFNEQYGNIASYSQSKYVEDSNAQKKMQALYTAPAGTPNASDYKAYRTKPTEIQAHGVGNMSVKGATATPGANPHLDPTMTQEFDILFSMFNSLPDNLKQNVASSRQNNVKENRKFYDDPYLPYATDIFSNPFQPTIK